MLNFCFRQRMGLIFQVTFFYEALLLFFTLTPTKYIYLLKDLSMTNRLIVGKVPSLQGPGLETCKLGNRGTVFSNGAHTQ